jgi:hypothetical protein
MLLQWCFIGVILLHSTMHWEAPDYFGGKNGVFCCWAFMELATSGGKSPHGREYIACKAVDLSKPKSEFSLNFVRSSIKPARAVYESL